VTSRRTIRATRREDPGSSGVSCEPADDSLRRAPVHHPVDGHRFADVRGESSEERAREADGIDTHPIARGVRSLALRGHAGPKRSLAPEFDDRVGRFAYDRDVGRQQLGTLPGELYEAVPFRAEFLTVVEDPRDVDRGR
jgi:hypothetical protein